MVDTREVEVAITAVLDSLDFSPQQITRFYQICPDTDTLTSVLICEDLLSVIKPDLMDMRLYNAANILNQIGNIPQQFTNRNIIDITPRQKRLP